jgi:hypothetical protein
MLKMEHSIEALMLKMKPLMVCRSVVADEEQDPKIGSGSALKRKMDPDLDSQKNNADPQPWFFRCENPFLVKTLYHEEKLWGISLMYSRCLIY